MRRAPPVTNAAFGIGGIGKPPCTSRGSAPSGPDTAFPARTLAAGAHLSANHFARRHTGSPQCRATPRAAPLIPDRAIRRQSEIGLFEAANLVAQARRFLEFEIGSDGAHAFFEIGDDRLQIPPLVVRRLVLAETDGDVVLFIDAAEDI